MQTERMKRAFNKPPEPEVPRQPRQPAQWKAPKPTTGNTKIFKVSIMDTNGPLSQEQADSIQKTILERINLDENEDGPRFLGCYKRCGGLQLTCANMKSKDWLIEQVATIKPWEKADLVVEDQQKKLIATSFIPDSQIEEEPLLNLLKTQNKEMNFSEWSVVRRKPELSGQIVTFSFDEESLKPLFDRKFYLFLGLGKIQIRMKKKNSEKGNPIQLPDTIEVKQEINTQVYKSEPGNSKGPAKKKSKKKKSKGGRQKPTARSQNWSNRKTYQQN